MIEVESGKDDGSGDVMGRKLTVYVAAMTVLGEMFSPVYQGVS